MRGGVAALSGPAIAVRMTAGKAAAAEAAGAGTAVAARAHVGAAEVGQNVAALAGQAVRIRAALAGDTLQERRSRRRACGATRPAAAFLRRRSRIGAARRANRQGAGHEEAQQSKR